MTIVVCIAFMGKTVKRVVGFRAVPSNKNDKGHGNENCSTILWNRWPISMQHGINQHVDRCANVSAQGHENGTTHSLSCWVQMGTKHSKLSNQSCPALKMLSPNLCYVCGEGGPWLWFQVTWSIISHSTLAALLQHSCSNFASKELNKKTPSTF